ncbi:MAG: hypothetical protein QM723_21100 [Myxococcaceae bacterium]
MRQVRTIEAAREWLERVGYAPMAANIEGHVSLVEAITGERLKKSWWGHKDGKLIFAIASELEDEALGMKLLEGKMTLVHRRLWADVLAVVTGEDFRLPLASSLSKRANALYEQVWDDGPVQGADKIATEELERKLLLHVTSVHTAKGRHEKRLDTWERWAEQQHIPRPDKPQNDFRSLISRLLITIL